MCRLPPRKTRREQSVEPENDGGRRPGSEKDDGLGDDGRQENLPITDRGEPQPIDQEVAREPKQDQANPADDGRDDVPDHGAPSGTFRLGPAIPIVIAQ